MNLLDATVHVLEAARETPAADRTPLRQAIRRLERRVRVLRLRAAKLLRKRRWAAFYYLCIVYRQNRPPPPRPAPQPDLEARCLHCHFKFDFKSFIRIVQLG